MNARTQVSLALKTQYGLDEKGEINAKNIDDLFLSLVYVLVRQTVEAIETLEAVEAGTYSDCDHDGVKRAYTPKQAAQLSMAKIQRLDLATSFEVDAFTLVRSVLSARYPSSDDITDPLDKKMFIIMQQYTYAKAILNALIDEAYKSKCEHDYKYAGGNISDGSRLYTPSEGMTSSLEIINEFEKQEKDI
jgi:hypothetical protein